MVAGRAGLLVALLLAGCRAAVFQCTTDVECGEGFCAAGGWCAFPTADCESGLRYGEHADGGLASTCVPVEGAGSSDGASMSADGSAAEGLDGGLDDADATSSSAGDAGSDTSDADTVSLDEGTGDATVGGTDDATTSAVDCATWWDTSWPFRRPLAIAPGTDVADLADFPLSVNVAEITTDGDGSDLRFVGEGCTLLAHEIEQADNDAAIAWVLIPEVDASAELHVYYGNSGAPSVENPQGVWDADFVAVYHLDDLSDASGNGNDLSVFGNPVSAAGQLGLAYDFDGNGDRLVAAAAPMLANMPQNGMTISGWVRSDVSSYVADSLVDKADASNANGGFVVAVDGALTGVDLRYERGHAQQEYVRETISGPMDVGALHHFAVLASDGVLGNHEVTLFVDGVQVGGNSTAGWGSSQSDAMTPLSLGGAPYSSNNSLTGLLDEIRVSTTLRSPEWIAAEYEAGMGQLLVIGRQEQL